MFTLPTATSTRCAKRIGAHGERPLKLHQRFETDVTRSAATAFVIIALCFRWIRSRKDAAQFPATYRLPAATIVLWCMLALVLYGRVLFTGFLSDDYVLIDRASRWSIGAVTTELFRPVPLALWAVLLHAGAGAVTLHLLNIIVHGTNAFLLTRIVARLLAGRFLPMLAGGLLLTFPLASEAVVWCSGVFDVLATALVLGCVLASRGYDIAPTIGRRCSFFALGLTAFLSKKQRLWLACSCCSMYGYANRGLARSL